MTRDLVLVITQPQKENIEKNTYDYHTNHNNNSTICCCDKCSEDDKRCVFYMWNYSCNYWYSTYFKISMLDKI